MLWSLLLPMTGPLGWGAWHRAQLPLLWEKFCDLIFLQSVGCPSGWYGIWLHRECTPPITSWFRLLASGCRLFLVCSWEESELKSYSTTLAENLCSWFGGYNTGIKVLSEFWAISLSCFAVTQTPTKWKNLTVSCPQAHEPQTNWNQKVDNVDSWWPHHQPIRRMSMSWSCTPQPSPTPCL